MTKRRQIDMSPKAIDERLAGLGALYTLGVSLTTARRIGRVEDLKHKVGCVPLNPAGWS